MLPIYRINNANNSSDCNSTPSTNTVTSSKQSSTVNNIIIDIPPELLQSGNTLLVEKHSELFVDGRHLSQPPHPIRQAHGLCLIDTQQQDQRSVTATHQLQDTTEDSEVIQIKVEVPPDILQNGKTITIQKSSTTIDRNQQPQLLGNYVDLYSDQHSIGSLGTNNIHIEIPNQLIERGQTILVQKENVSIMKTDEYDKQQTHHLASNQFTKRDHLQSKNLMEMTFLLSPEFLNNGQTIMIRQEDPESIDTDHHHHYHHHHHHQATSDINQSQLTNDDSSRSGGVMSKQE